MLEVNASGSLYATTLGRIFLGILCLNVAVLLSWLVVLKFGQLPYIIKGVKSKCHVSSPKFFLGYYHEIFVS